MNAFVEVFAGAKNRLFIGGRPIVADSAADEIESFAFLPRGWDYGKGGPISKEVRTKALEWLAKLHSIGFTEIEAFPGESEAMLTVSANNHYFELIIESDRSITISYDFKRKRVFYLPHMSDHDAWQAIIWIKTQMISEGLRDKKWSAFGYFILVDTTKKNANSPDLRFVIRGSMTQDYLWWSGNASVPIQARFAPTFENTISKNFQRSLGSLPSFGGLTPIENYQIPTR